MAGADLNDFVFFDTDVLIDIGREVPEAVDRLRAETSRAVPAVSSIVQMELLAGCRDRAELRKFDRFIGRFRVVKLDGPICDRTVTLLKRFGLSHGLRMPDALIAATALVCGRPLLTKNRKDYRFIRGLALPDYP